MNTTAPLRDAAGAGVPCVNTATDGCDPRHARPARPQRPAPVHRAGLVWTKKVMELFPDIIDTIHPAAPYIGGKRRLAKMLCRAIDRLPHHSYGEVFMGMGGVFLRRTRVPPAEFINDWSEDVATFYRILQRHYVAFLDMLRFQISTRSGFERLMKVDPTTLTDLERAARFLYLQRLAYGGKVAGRTFGVDPRGASGFDITKVGPLLEEIHERLARVTIERLTWSDFLSRYDTAETLFYLDPPYYGSEGDYGKELFGREQFPLMGTQLAGIDGRFLLSLNDHPDVRQIFEKFAMQSVDVVYTVGGGDHAQRAQELIISNLSQPELERVLK